jgi:Family of unknown function (DUF5996)
VEAVSSELPLLLPLAEWEPTKTTVHLWAQIVGKVRLALAPPRNHWWHVPLYVDVRGLTTRRLHANGSTFQIDFDFVDHRLRVRRGDGKESSFQLRDGLSVADFDEELHASLRGLGVDVAIREEPFGVPSTTPFQVDREHASYDPGAVAAFWRSLDWADRVFEEFAGRFDGKTSPVHLFWHSLDLAFARYSGMAAPPLPEADAITREAYSHEVIAFGFWAGDDQLPEPAFYSYTSPEPEALREEPLAPREARWVQRGTGSLALLTYEAARASADPRRTVLTFLESAYEAGTRSAGWRAAALEAAVTPR